MQQELSLMERTIDDSVVGIGTDVAMGTIDSAVSRQETVINRRAFIANILAAASMVQVEETL